MSLLHTIVTIGCLIILALLVFGNDRLEHEKVAKWLPITIMLLIVLLMVFTWLWSMGD
jgi:multisubunit Na+/H+ antiporter MnhB subunit